MGPSSHGHWFWLVAWWLCIWRLYELATFLQGKISGNLFCGQIAPILLIWGNCDLICDYRPILVVMVQHLWVWVALGSCAMRQKCKPWIAVAVPFADVPWFVGVVVAALWGGQHRAAASLSLPIGTMTIARELPTHDWQPTIIIQFCGQGRGFANFFYYRKRAFRLL